MDWLRKLIWNYRRARLERELVDLFVNGPMHLTPRGWRFHRLLTRKRPTENEPG